MPVNYRGVSNFIGNLQVGAAGTNVTEILTGSVTISAPSLVAGSSGNATASIAGLNQDAHVILTAGSLPNDLVIQYATASNAGEVKVTFLNTAEANSTGCAITLYYTAFATN